MVCDYEIEQERVRSVESEARLAQIYERQNSNQENNIDDLFAGIGGASTSSFTDRN